MKTFAEVLELAQAAAAAREYMTALGARHSQPTLDARIKADAEYKIAADMWFRAEQAYQAGMRDYTP